MSFEDMLKEKEKLESRIKVLDKKLAELNKKLKEACKCLAECIEETSVYYDGDYYNKAHTRTYKMCSICGKTSDSKIEYHSWYG